MKLRIKNDTDYRGKDIRRFVLRSLRENGVSEEEYYFLHVRYGKNRGQGTTGYGYYHRNHIILLFDKEWKTDTSMPLTKKALYRLACTMTHEVAHNRGLRHGEMYEHSHGSQDENKWVEDYQIRRKPSPKRITMGDRVVKREEKARKALERWERKLKLAKTYIRKWKSKVRYYEKRKAASKEVKRNAKTEGLA